MAGAVTLLPSYVKVLTSLKQQEKVLVAKKSEAQESKNFSEEVKQTKDLLNVLTQNEQKEHLTTLIDELLNSRPEGISLLGYGYERGSNSLVIEGFSETRDIVAPFARKLEDNPFFNKVPVPISDLAKNKNLDFRMQASLVSEDVHEEN